MSSTMTLNPENRIDFVYLFDVRDGNPNGDPVSGNSPRIDPETGQGLITDVCLKRKIRDYVTVARTKTPGYEIYVKHRGILANEQKRAFLAVKELPSESENHKARDWMCKNFFDVRSFGAVMNTGKVEEADTQKSSRKGQNKAKWNCGQVRGPLQVTFARSINPIADLEQAITRVALTNAGDTGRESSIDETGQEVAGSGQFGRKSIVPYALYRAHIFFNPHFAADTGFNAEDLELTIEALKGMFEIDRSATRGQMSAQSLIAFQHDSPLGRAPAGKLFERVNVVRVDAGRPPRAFSDYKVTIDDNSLPQGVSVLPLL